jgi:hypothetical protein
MLLSGSEETVTFADDAGCTFTVAYCCSFPSDGNSCVVAEHSPLLDVTLRDRAESTSEAGRGGGAAPLA